MQQGHDWAVSLGFLASPQRGFAEQDQFRQAFFFRRSPISRRTCSSSDSGPGVGSVGCRPPQALPGRISYRIMTCVPLLIQESPRLAGRVAPHLLHPHAWPGSRVIPAKLTRRVSR